MVKCDGCGVKKEKDEKYWKAIKSKPYCPKCTTKKGYDPKRPGLHKKKNRGELDDWK